MASNQHVNKVVYGNSTLIDISDTTATASKILQGFGAYGADGSWMTGLAPELEIETGTYTPSSNASRPTINFSKTHARVPSFIYLIDSSDASTLSANSGTSFLFNSSESSLNGSFPMTPDGYRYGAAVWTYYGSDSAAHYAGKMFDYPSTNPSSSDSSYLRYYATESSFRPYIGSSSRYWRSGRSYKWIAIWVPQST